MEKNINQQINRSIFNFNLAENIENWWKNEDQNQDFYILKIKLSHLLIHQLNKDDLQWFKKIGLSQYKIAGICIRNIFKKVEESPSRIMTENQNPIATQNEETITPLDFL